MPTAAKLVAAIFLALTGYLAADAVRHFLPEGQPIKWLYPVCIAIPVICGWRTLGRMVGRSYLLSINFGIYAITISVFFVLLVFSFIEMIKRSMRMQYDGPLEAVVAMFGILTEYGALLLNPSVALILLGGAVCSGLGTEWTSRRWA